MNKNLRDGIGANGKLCSKCGCSVSGELVKLCRDCYATLDAVNGDCHFFVAQEPVKLCRDCYATLCLVCANTHRC